MFVYEKRLQYPIKIKNTNPKLAALIISQYGGPNSNKLQKLPERLLRQLPSYERLGKLSPSYTINSWLFIRFSRILSILKISTAGRNFPARTIAKYLLNLLLIAFTSLLSCMTNGFPLTVNGPSMYSSVTGIAFPIRNALSLPLTRAIWQNRLSPYLSASPSAFRRYFSIRLLSGISHTIPFPLRIAR